MVLNQKLPFFNLFFCRQYSIGKRLLRYSRTKKRLTRLTEKEVQKNRKIHSFSKGLVHGFGLNMAIFPTFFFWQYRPQKRLLRYSRTKKRLSRL